MPSLKSLGWRQGAESWSDTLNYQNKSGHGRMGPSQDHIGRTIHSSPRYSHYCNRPCLLDFSNETDISPIYYVGVKYLMFTCKIKKSFKHISSRIYIYIFHLLVCFLNHQRSNDYQNSICGLSMTSFSHPALKCLKPLLTYWFFIPCEMKPCLSWNPVSHGVLEKHTEMLSQSLI